MKKTLITATAIALLFGSAVPAFAQTTTPGTSALLQLQSQVADLQAKLAALKTAQTNVQSSAQSIGASLQLIANLRQGMSGDDVKLLQSILASDPTLFSGQVTGFFGPATAKAVQKFQKNNGISTTGSVGPMTREAINKLLKSALITGSTTEGATTTWNGSGHENEGVKFCLGVAPGHLVAPGQMNRGENEHGRGKGENGGNATSTLSGTVLTCTKIPPGIAKKLGLPTMMGGGHDNDHSTTTPPTNNEGAPAISAVVVTPTANGASINWMTNKPATSKIYVSLTAPVSTSTATWTDASLNSTHSASLTSLVSGTVYHFVITATDGMGRTSVTSDATFTTTGTAPDTTAPVISSLGASVGSATTTIAWVTNESANSKVYYATTTPVNTGTAWTASSASLVTLHSLDLTGLMASTTYYAIVTSADASGNTATSSQINFTQP